MLMGKSSKSKARGSKFGVKLLQKGEDWIELEVDGIDYSMANAIRRSARNNVYTLAVEYVDIIKNTSALYNEMLAHRIGLVPLKFDPKRYVPKDKCDCKGKGCPKCEVKLVLHKKGPCTVYAKDMKSSDESVKPVNGDEIIVKLKEGQEINLEATAILATGKRHARWQSCVIGYRYFPELRINGKVENPKEVVKACPTKALKLEGNTIKLADPYKCDLCGLCKEVSENAVEVVGDDTRIIFKVESVCGLPPAEIMKASLKSITEELADFEKELSAKLKA